MKEGNHVLTGPPRIALTAVHGFQAESGAAVGGTVFAGLCVFPRADRSSFPGLRAGLSRHILPPLRSSPVFHGPGTAPLPLAIDPSAGKANKNDRPGE